MESSDFIPWLLFFLSKVYSVLIKHPWWAQLSLACGTCWIDSGPQGASYPSSALSPVLVHKEDVHLWKHRPHARGTLREGPQELFAIRPLCSESVGAVDSTLTAHRGSPKSY